MNNFFEDLLNKSTTNALERLLALESDNFNDIAEALNLDKRTDFRYSDLKNVCVDDCDLSDYDFTGADLRGVTGRNVKWNASTKLKGALLNGSLFAYEFSKAEFFEREPTWHKIYLRKEKEHWAGNINWFADNLAKKNKDQGKIVEVARALCDSTKDEFLRSQLLLFTASGFVDKSEHRDYLIHNMAKHYSSPTTIRSTIRAMASLYGADEIVFNILRRELSNNDPSIRDAALRGMIDSSFLRKETAMLAEIVKGYPADLRRLFAQRVAESINKVFVQYIKEPYGNIVIDFQEPISRQKLVKMAHSQIYAEAIQKRQGRMITNPDQASPNIRGSDVGQRVEWLCDRIEILIRIGIPFILTE